MQFSCGRSGFYKLVHYLKINKLVFFKSGSVLKQGVMKKIIALELFFLMTLLGSCSLVEGIFKAGVWIGIMASAVVVGLVIYIMMRMRRK